MQAKTLLDENTEPSDEEIKHCLKDTYCRCTGYTSILNSVRAAAAEDAHRLHARAGTAHGHGAARTASANRCRGPMRSPR